MNLPWPVGPQARRGRDLAMPREPGGRERAGVLTAPLPRAWASALEKREMGGGQWPVSAPGPLTCTHMYLVSHNQWHTTVDNPYRISPGHAHSLGNTHGLPPYSHDTPGAQSHGRGRGPE